jgi:hypothetical protein
MQQKAALADKTQKIIKIKDELEVALKNAHEIFFFLIKLKILFFNGKAKNFECRVCEGQVF